MLQHTARGQIWQVVPQARQVSTQIRKWYSAYTYCKVYLQSMQQSNGKADQICRGHNAPNFEQSSRLERQKDTWHPVSNMEIHWHLFYSYGMQAAFETVNQSWSGIESQFEWSARWQPMQMDYVCRKVASLVVIAMPCNTKLKNTTPTYSQTTLGKLSSPCWISKAELQKCQGLLLAVWT